jgi:large subunit ribosomal protein L4
MQIDLYTKDGSVKEQIELPSEIFGIEPNEHAMYLAVNAYLTNKRQGTAKTKTKAEVRGGGKKPWRQKGRGTARSGSSRSPIWVGGGTIHGPEPRDYNFKLPKKVKRLARKSAFSTRLSENNILVVEDFSFDEIKTKNMVEVLKNLQIDEEKTLILLPQNDDVVFISARNIPNISVYPADKISTYDILNHKKILLFKSAIETIVKTFGNQAEN